MKLRIIDITEVKKIQKEIDYLINKDKLNKRQRENKTKKIHTDINFAIRERLRGRFRIALKQQSISKAKSIELYGINIQDIINHLGPCPGDRKEYHIDHIKPLSSFDLSKESEIQKAFASNNHQWLLAKDNISKGAKY